MSTGLAIIISSISKKYALSTCFICLSLYLLNSYLQASPKYVENLINATDYNKCVTPDFDGQLIQDLDLNTLGADYIEYDKYSNQIRCEYIQYPDSVFYKERIKVLNNFLNRKYIFNTKYYRDNYEYIARANLIKELSKIVPLVD